MTVPTYIPAEKSKEWISGPPETRYIDHTFYVKISGKVYHTWDAIEIKYSRENFAATASMSFPRYYQDYDGKRKNIFTNPDEKDFIRSTSKVVGPKGKPVVEIYFADELMFYGIADNIEFTLNGFADERVNFSCRDLMGELAIDKILAGENIPNNTSGELVKLYVEKALGVYGVKAEVNPATNKPIGSFASSQYRFIPQNKSRLDVITDMAAFEDRVFYLRGNVFYFVPPRKAKDFPTFDVVYGQHTQNITLRKNWSSENLMIEGRTKGDKNSKGKNISAKAQPIVERVGNGSIVVKVPTNKTWKFGAGRKKEEAREILRAYLQSIYEKMSERIMSGTVNDLPGDISKREFNFKVRILNVGLGLSQHYLPLEITHKVTREGTYRMSYSVANIPEGAEEAVQAGTFAPGEFEPED